ncbi:MAG: hypothetical protein A2X23_01760 [Chloroflexi bacterium GWC2_73_18]|nr:MAG: hypothetical protein A2X23_01760 [Chloroflexi bacterium GWC2_73_18]
MSRTSAGILLYHLRDERLELLLAHPGGPFFAQKDLRSWSIPKGEIEEGEEPLAVARREFAEETGHGLPPPEHAAYRPLGEVRQKSGKLVLAWALEGDLDPATAVSNTFELEWPPGSGQQRAFPEIDRVAWFDPAEARRRIGEAQAAFVERLEVLLRAE